MAITAKEINLTQLTKELGGRGLVADFNDPKKKIILPAENSGITEEELESAIAAHIAGKDEKEIIKEKRAELLERLGITEEEAKLLLG